MGLTMGCLMTYLGLSPSRSSRRRSTSSAIGFAPRLRHHRHLHGLGQFHQCQFGAPPRHAPDRPISACSASPACSHPGAVGGSPSCSRGKAAAPAVRRRCWRGSHFLLALAMPNFNSPVDGAVGRHCRHGFVLHRLLHHDPGCGDRHSGSARLSTARDRFRSPERLSRARVALRRA